jgi:hypothetical protein
MRNVFRYSPLHLYEHVYLSSERYAWQCLRGEQRGHGDVDLSTLWKFADGLYLFCFREFVIPVADHRRAGGHIYPLGAVRYPDVQPV